MASESALAAREARLARREQAMKNHSIILRAEEEVTRSKQKEQGVLRRAAEQPAIDSIAEFGGTLGEAALKKELPTIYPFVGPVALVTELAALYMLYKNPKSTEYRTVASLARGAQARARVTIADSTVAAIFA